MKMDVLSTSDLIIDSGWGGLTVVSRLIRHSPPQQNLGYVNVALSAVQGFNDLQNTSDKVQAFEQQLQALQHRYHPNHIFVACHTLSVLLSQVLWPATHSTLTGIAQLSRDFLQHQWQPQAESAILFFGTPTTLESGYYSKLFEQSFPQTPSVFQGCPGLATFISNHLDEKELEEEISKWAMLALGQLQAQVHTRPKHLYVFLGCTHYSIHPTYFQKALAQHVDCPVEVLDPAIWMTTHIQEQWASQKPIISPQPFFIDSPYPIPPNEQKTWKALTAEVSSVVSSEI